MWAGFTWLIIRISGGFCDYVVELSDSTNWGEFHVWFKNSCCMELVTVALFIVGPYLVDYIEWNCHCKWKPQCFIQLHCKLLRLYSVGNRGVKCVEHWWSAIDRGNPKYSERNLSLCQFVHHKSQHGLTWDRNRVCAIRGRHSYVRCRKRSVPFAHLIGLYFHSLQKQR